MEDKQPASGDLTGAAPDEPRADVTDDEAADDGATDKGATDTSDEAADDTADEETDDTTDEAEAPAKVRKPLSGRMAVAAVGLSAALFVAAGAFAGATVQPYLMDRAAVATKLDIAQTAANAITTLWTYTPDDMDKLPDRSSKYLSGDFQEQYRKYVDAIVPTNKQAKVTNTTQVVGAAVESLRGSEATAIVYTNTTSTSPLSKNIPSLRYLSYRLQLKREGSEWLVTKMTTVTSLDLTPQL